MAFNRTNPKLWVLGALSLFALNGCDMLNPRNSDVVIEGRVKSHPVTGEKTIQLAKHYDMGLESGHIYEVYETDCDSTSNAAFHMESSITRSMKDKDQNNRRPVKLMGDLMKKKIEIIRDIAQNQDKPSSVGLKPQF